MGKLLRKVKDKIKKTAKKTKRRLDKAVDKEVKEQPLGQHGIARKIKKKLKKKGKWGLNKKKGSMGDMIRTLTKAYKTGKKRRKMVSDWYKKGKKGKLNIRKKLEP